MARYRIVCVRTSQPHRHIAYVGTGIAPGSVTRRWSVEDVRRALAAGDVFYTQSPSTGHEADVLVDNCRLHGCAVLTIRSSQGAILDNNPGYLPGCW